MTREEARKLIGGYAFNTLTEQEKEALFAAALEDQEIFDALQSDQALRDFLDDSASRAALRQALHSPRKPWYGSWWTWSAASVVLAAILLAILPQRHPAPRKEMAQLTPNARPPMAMQPPTEAPSPARAPRNDIFPKKAAPRTLALNAPKPKATAGNARQSENTQLDSAKEALAAPLPPATQTVEAQAAAPALREKAFGMLNAIGAPQSPIILRRQTAGDFLPLGSNPLHNGDLVRIAFRPDTSGKLQLYLRDENGVLTLLVPAIDAASGTRYELPPTGGITVDQEITLVVSLTRPGAATRTTELRLKPTAP
jgi:hypothetical protein